jgi:RimJ/RimL family protein N-acetyltransferase
MEHPSSRPFRANDLQTVEPWFDDPETQRWLGDRGWPRRLLDLARRPNRFALLYLSADTAVGLLDIEMLSDRQAAAAIVVSPKHRGGDIATEILRTVAARPEIEGIDEVVGEIEIGNACAERCLRAAGFVHRPEAAREDGFLRFVRQAS